MKQVGTNIRKLLPSLALGVFITLMAGCFNYLIHFRQIPDLLYDAALPIAAHPGIAQPEGAAPTRADPNNNPFFQAIRFLTRSIRFADDVVIDIFHIIRGDGGLPKTEDSIAVVAIDNESVQRLGSWPWSRRAVANLVSRVVGAKVVGVDLIFDELDRTSLGNYVRIFDALYGIRLDVENIDPETMNNDIFLYRELSRGQMVLGSVLHTGIAPQDKPEQSAAFIDPVVLLPNGARIDPGEALLKQATYAITDIAILRDGPVPPAGEGFTNLFPASGSMVRNVSLLARLPSWAFSDPSRKGMLIYPSLPLEMVRVAMGGDGYALNLSNRGVEIPDPADPDGIIEQKAVRSVSITLAGPEGKAPKSLLTIPLNEVGEMKVSFWSRRGDFRVYPAWEVLAGKHNNAFKDKLVLIGETISGTGAFSTSGLPVSDLSRVTAHASILASMQKRDFMVFGYRNDYVYQQVMLLLSGLAVSVALIFGSIGIGMLVSALVMVTLLLVNYFLFFRHGSDIGVVIPLFSTMTVLVFQAFVNYLIIGHERRFIRKAFSLSVSPSILGYLESRPDRLSSLQGENRVMTVLFSDIRGFTRISEKMTAPDLALFLNEYFTPMSDVVMENMGTVDKFMGDAIMAFWNAPADNPRHAQDAARSALAMQRKLGELQEGWTSRGLPKVSIGCGINSGPMFAGYMGSEQRKNYTVMGDNVNIASRLESLNKFYSSGILITDATRKLLGGEFHCRVVDKVRVSGKEDTVIIHELLGEGAPAEEESEELAAFARVFELYHLREFAAAESLLKELVFIRPNPLYKLYLDRLAVYLALPPPDDWDGTFSMTNK